MLFRAPGDNPDGRGGRDKRERDTRFQEKSHDGGGHSVQRGFAQARHGTLPGGNKRHLSFATATEAGARGRGVLRAGSNVRDEIAPAVLGLDATDRRLVDRTMTDLDGTENKSQLKANSIQNCLAAARSAPLSGRGGLFFSATGLRGKRNPLPEQHEHDRLFPKILREDTTSQQNCSPRNRFVSPQRCRARQEKASL